jgi:Reverse transcriptase (RNA-dependent DNA polymerase)
MWFGRVPLLSHLREIGCHAFALTQTNNPKIYRRSKPCTLIGYAPHSKAYRLWDNTSNTVFNSFHVTFIEHLDSLPHDLLPGTTLLLEPDAPPSWEVPSPDQTLLLLSSSTEPSSHHSFIPCSSPIIPTVHTPSAIDPPAAPIASHQAPNDLPPQPLDNASDPPTPPRQNPPITCIPIRRSERIAARSLPPTTALLAEFSKISHLHDLLPLSNPDPSLPIDYVLSALADGSLEPSIDTGDDPSWADAIASPDREYWVAGARDELQSLKELQVFVLVPRSSLPIGRRPLKGKLVCKRKHNDSGKISRYKVRYVAKGYAQQYGIDYDKTTAPTARLESFRVVLHLAATLNWDLQQFDIKTAFLHGILPAFPQMRPHSWSNLRVSRNLVKRDG